MKTMVDRRREDYIKLQPTTKKRFFNTSCGLARAGGENFELHLAVLVPCLLP
jgi:hypothetical protein